MKVAFQRPCQCLETTHFCECKSCLIMLSNLLFIILTSILLNYACIEYPWVCSISIFDYSVLLLAPSLNLWQLVGTHFRVWVFPFQLLSSCTFNRSHKTIFIGKLAAQYSMVQHVDQQVMCIMLFPLSGEACFRVAYIISFK